MKLNYKRTLLVGFAFFLISTFWQAYDATIALTLTNKFGMDQFWSGVVMALDNILALFLLAVLTPEKVTRHEAHLGEHSRHAAQALSALLLQVLLLVCPHLELEFLQVVHVFQEEEEVLGLVGSPSFSHDLYMVDHVLAGKRRK